MRAHERPSLTCSEVRVESWQYGRSAAVAITLDDWTLGHLNVALPLLNELGLPGTFFLPLVNFGIAPSLDHWASLQKLIRDGHELGNHSRTHCDLRGLSPAHLYEEVSYPRELMLHHLCRPTIQSFCYPFGKFDDSAVREVAENHLGARIFEDEPKDLTFEYDFDYYRVPTVRVNADLSESALDRWLSKLLSGGGLMTMVVHGVYDDANEHDVGHYDAIHRDKLAALLERVRAGAEHLWITTFGEAIRYHRLASGSTCRVDGFDQHIQRLSLDVDVSWENSAGTQLTLTVARQPDLAVRAITQNGIVRAHRETKQGYSFEADATRSNIEILWGSANAPKSPD